ncbi:carbohydrate-binding protein, partial [Kibdelosporangium lantanae]
VSATTSGGGGGPVDYQAEDGVITNGVVESNHTGFTGRGFVNVDNATGSALEITVNAAAAGGADVVVRYSNNTTSTRPVSVSVNGGAGSTLEFPKTADWNTWATVTVHVNLNAGTNKIKFTSTTDNGGPNYDKITV